MAKARRAGKSAQQKIGRKVARKRSTLAAALQYARHGLAVFPIHTPTQDGCSCGKPSCNRVGKHPRTPHGVRDATTDEKAIRQWWNRWPDANVGIATGAASADGRTDSFSGDVTIVPTQSGRGAKRVLSIIGTGAPMRSASRLRASWGAPQRSRRLL